MKVRDILKKKGPEVFTIGEEKTLKEATAVLVNNRIGVLLVLNLDGKISGIISERDIVHQCHHFPTGFAQKLVKDAMTKEVIIVEPDDELTYIESVMTSNHIRHLPVVKDGALTGLISIGDIVKTMLSEASNDNKYLRDYIEGNTLR